MNQLNFNTEKRNFKHLSEYERGDIYAMIKLGCSISSIARHIKGQEPLFTMSLNVAG